jgi:hypothetical protein
MVSAGARRLGPALTKPAWILRLLAANAVSETSSPRAATRTETGDYGFNPLLELLGVCIAHIVSRMSAGFFIFPNDIFPYSSIF